MTAIGFALAILIATMYRFGDPLRPFETLGLIFAVGCWAPRWLGALIDESWPPIERRQR
jgi:hypothetical protein